MPGTLTERRIPSARVALAVTLSLAGHAALLAWALHAPSPARPAVAEVVRIALVLPAAHDIAARAQVRAPDQVLERASKPSPPATLPATLALPLRPAPIPVSVPPVAALAAPPAPTAEAWQLASTYTLKNSKRYRHSWAQLVRSGMGTAVAGPEQGQVRLRVTIAADGRLARVDVLWSTSATGSRLAQDAIRKLPPTPPTPTGEPLVFETTISYLPYETGWPPGYQNDCLPDAPVFRNPYAWQGGAAPQTVPLSPTAPDATAAECEPDAESLDEAAGDLQRQTEQNRWGR